MAIEEELLAAGFEVELAPDGEAALEAARRHLPDLLLTDLRMPRLDGAGLIRATVSRAVAARNSSPSWPRQRDGIVTRCFVSIAWRNSPA
jgi:CheY-like chemotaxis protein